MARFGIFDAVEWLLEKEVKVDHQSGGETKALMLAAGGGLNQPVKVLLLHGADVNLTNRI